MTPARTNWTGIGFGMALAVLAAYQQFKLPPALPQMMGLYGYDPVVAGAFMSVFAAAGLALSLLLGWRIQRHGAARFVAAAFALFAAGTLITIALPQHEAAVLAARTMEGVGFAVLAVVAPTIVALHAAATHKTIAAGLTATWIPAGQLAAIIVAGPALATGDWRLLWWIGLAATVLAAAWMAHLRHVGRIDLSARPPVGAPAAADDGGRRGDRTLVLAAAVFCLWSTQFIAYMTWLPSFLVDVHGLSPAAAAAAYAVPVAVLLAFNLATGLALHAGAPVGPLLAAALVLQAVVWAALPWTGAGGSGIASLVTYGVGAGIAPTCLFALPGVIFGHAGGGARAFGVLMTGRNLGVLVGPVLLAHVVGTRGGWDGAGAAFAVLTLTAALTAVWLAARLRRPV